MTEPKIISVINQKGGVGKTAIVDQLAFRFKNKGIEVAVQDVDGQQDTYFHKFFEIPENPELVLVDTRGSVDLGVGDDAHVVIDAADLVIIPTQLAGESVKKVDIAVKVCEHWNKKYCIVPSQTDFRTNLARTKYQELCRDYPGKVTKTGIRYAVVVAEAKDVEQQTKDLEKHDVTKDFEALADEILEMVK